MQRSLNHTHIDDVLPDDLERGNKKSSSSEKTNFGDVARLGSRGLEDRLEKLSALRAESKNNIMKLDGDIEALERTLDILRESYPEESRDEISPCGSL